MPPGLQKRVLREGNEPPKEVGDGTKRWPEKATAYIRWHADTVAVRATASPSNPPPASHSCDDRPSETSHKHTPACDSFSCPHFDPQSDYDPQVHAREKARVTSDALTCSGIEPFALRLGLGLKFAALETCVQSMAVGEKAVFAILPPDTAGALQLELALRAELGDRAAAELVRPRCACASRRESEFTALPPSLRPIFDPMTANLLVTVELVSIAMPDTVQRDVWELAPAEKIELAQRFKHEASALLTRGDHAGARPLFERVVRIADSFSSWTELETVSADARDELFASSRLNYSLCLFKTNEYAAAEKALSRSIDSGAVGRPGRSESACRLAAKTFLRRGVARSHVGRDLDGARSDFDHSRAILEAGPCADAPALLEAIQVYEAQLDRVAFAAVKAEQQLWRRVLSG